MISTIEAPQVITNMIVQSPVRDVSKMKDRALPQSQLAIVSPVLGESLDQRIFTVPIRQPKPGEVVVKMEYTGICESDVKFSLMPRDGSCVKDHIAGHEGIGRIVRSEDSFLIGKPVGIRYLGSYCGSCQYCLHDLPESCPDSIMFPIHLNGTYQQYVTAPLKALMPLPEWVLHTSPTVSTADYTVALCSGAAALRALKKLAPRPSDVIVISGVCGGIGHLAGLMARKIYGAKVIGVDWSWKGEALDASGICDKFVAVPQDEFEKSTFQARVTDACISLRSTLSGVRRADGLILAASHESAFTNVTEYVGDGGTIICLGVPKSLPSLSIPITELVERAITIRGMLMGGWDESYQVMDYIRTGRIQPVVTKLKLEDVPSYMTAFSEFKNVGKGVVRMC